MFGVSGDWAKNKLLGRGNRVVLYEGTKKLMGKPSGGAKGGGERGRGLSASRTGGGGKGDCTGREN